MPMAWDSTINSYMCFYCRLLYDTDVAAKLLLPQMKSVMRVERNSCLVGCVEFCVSATRLLKLSAPRLAFVCTSSGLLKQEIGQHRRVKLFVSSNLSRRADGQLRKHRGSPLALIRGHATCGRARIVECAGTAHAGTLFLFCVTRY